MSSRAISAQALIAALFAALFISICVWRGLDNLVAASFVKMLKEAPAPRPHGHVLDKDAEAPMQETELPTPISRGKMAKVPKQGAQVPTEAEVPVPRLGNDLLDRFIVVPEHHLLFCYIEKVGCSGFNELFKRLRSRYEPRQANGSIWWRNTPAHHHVKKKGLENMLVNKTWHKAVFYRDPVKRFVSAFKSKCGHADWDGKRHCKRQFGHESIDFGDAVRLIGESDANGTRDDTGFDVHWRRMGDFCGGLSHTLQYYNTVEKLDIQTSNMKVSKLLVAVGVDPQSIKGFDGLFPAAGTKTALAPPGHNPHHITNTESNLDRYFPPAVAKQRISVLAEHYKEDYELFGMQMPNVALPRPP